MHEETAGMLTWVLPDQAPLADLYAPNEASTSGRLAEPLARARDAWTAAGGERSLGGADLRCVLPLPRIGMWAWQVLCPCAAVGCSRACRRSPDMLASVMQAAHWHEKRVACMHTGRQWCMLW